MRFCPKARVREARCVHVGSHYSERFLATCCYVCVVFGFLLPKNSVPCYCFSRNLCFLVLFVRKTQKNPTLKRKTCQKPYGSFFIACAKPKCRRLPRLPALRGSRRPPAPGPARGAGPRAPGSGLGPGPGPLAPGRRTKTSSKKLSICEIRPKNSPAPNLRGHP